MTTTTKPRRRARRVPEFMSYEEEANFWDTHSPLDYPDDFDFDASDVTFASPLEIVRVRNWHKTLTDTLAALPVDQREVLTLNMLGLYPADIARVTGRSESDCLKALRAARRKTRRLTGPSGKQTAA